MLSLPTSLLSELGSTPANIATCFKIIRKDGVINRFTNYDKELIINGDAYLPNSGFLPSDVESSTQLGASNSLQIMGLLKTISKDDLQNGLYDFAEIEIFQVSHTSPDDGKISLFNGHFGKIIFKDNQFYSELSSLSNFLDKGIVSNYSPFCRTNLGDDKCKKDLASFTFNAEVISIINNREFIIDEAQQTGYFSNGKVEFTSGANKGLAMEVKQSEQVASGSKITLSLPMPQDIAIADSLTITTGCDKSFKTCKEKFDNALNFRGEPHLPGVDAIARI